MALPQVLGGSYTGSEYNDRYGSGRRTIRRTAHSGTMDPFDLGQYGARSDYHKKYTTRQARSQFGEGTDEFNMFLDGLNADVGTDVANFYGVGGYYGGTRGPFYQGGVGSGQVNESYNPYANININRYNHLNKKDNPADKLYADLIRAQTRDYETRFAPVERFMADQITATGTKSLEGDLTRTRGAVLGANTNVEGQQQRAMARMGLNYNPASENNMGTVGALVGGLNDTKLRDSDRRNAILSGNLGALSQKARGSVS